MSGPLSYYNKNSLRNWIAIDGKSLRSTINNYSSKSQNFVVIVSFFSQEFGLVLNVNRFENNKKLRNSPSPRCCKGLAPLIIKVFTMDSLHCQKITTQDIRESNNHYLIAREKKSKKTFSISRIY